MSNRFVSGGTIDPSGEVTKDASAPSAPAPARNKEWEAVQKELEAERQRREEARAKAAAGQERSLYDILQENKAAKQAEFDEKNKLRNQFRALDDDEVDFLDEVRAKKRGEEERVRKETEEGLKAFRARQKGEGAGEPDEEEDLVGEESWGTGRKRKRVKDREVKGVKRKVSESKGESVEVKKDEREDSREKKEEKPAEKTVSPAPKKTGLGLVGYGSDSDDDDDDD